MGSGGNTAVRLAWSGATPFFHLACSLARYLLLWFSLFYFPHLDDRLIDF